MRFLRRDLKPVYVFEEKQIESVYAGTETADVYTHTVMCNVQPADSRITAEAYGERSYSMLSIMCGKNDTVSGKVSFDGADKPTHRVVSEKAYTEHKVVLAEAIV